MKLSKKISIWKVLRFTTAMVAIFSIIFSAVLYLKRNTWVVIAHFGGASIYNEHSYEVLNPFRDRPDEIKAESFFSEFQKHCALALAAISDDPEHIRYTCHGEELHPLIGWRLRAKRPESSSVVVLRYEVTRYKSTDSTRKFDDPFWLRVTKENTEWRVTSYETWY